MAKESKNLLTREFCKKELLRWAKGELLPDVVLLAIMLFVFVPFIFLSISIAKYILILGIVLALICAVVPIIFVCRIILDMIALRLVKQGGFSIVKDTVLRLSKDELSKNDSEGGQYVDVIYFSEHGRYIASGVAFDISSVGDEFYLVILHAKKEKIVFAFHSMMYDYKEVL